MHRIWKEVLLIFILQISALAKLKLEAVPYGDLHCGPHFYASAPHPLVGPHINEPIMSEFGLPKLLYWKILSLNPYSCSNVAGFLKGTLHFHTKMALMQRGEMVSDHYIHLTTNLKVFNLWPYTTSSSTFHPFPNPQHLT